MTATLEHPAYQMPPHVDRWAGTLTTQEARVAHRIAQGLTNRQIAAELVVTEQTIKFHATNVFRKLGVRGRTGQTGPADGDSRVKTARWWIEHVEAPDAAVANAEADGLKALVARLWALRSSTATYQIAPADRAIVNAVLGEEA